MSQIKRIPLKTVLPELSIDAHSPIGHKTFESGQIAATDLKKIASQKGSASQLEKEGTVSVKAATWVTSVSYSADSLKCLVGYNTGKVAYLETNNWKLLKELEISKAGISAIDFTKDGMFVLVEDTNKKTYGFKLLPNSLVPVPLLELQKSNPVWINGSIFSSWSVG